MVYFIQRKLDNAIKIGFTRNIQNRFKRIKYTEYWDIELLKTIEGGFKKENELHKKFESIRKEGEWFENSIELLNFIENQNVINIEGYEIDQKIKHIIDLWCEAIYNERIKLKLTQTELSKKSGVCRKLISDIEQKKHTMSFYSILKIMNSLDILGEDVSIKPETIIPTFQTYNNEFDAIQRALHLTKQNKSAAAKMLNIDRKTLYNKMKKYENVHYIRP